MARRSSMQGVVVRSVLSSMGLLLASNASAGEAGTSSDPLPSVAPEVRASPSPGPLVERETDQGRLRIGFDLGGGVGVGGGVSGAVYAAKLRAGWQFNHLMAAYLQGSMFGWDSSEKRSADGSYSSRGILGLQASPLFSLTPGDLFELAAGPSLAHLVPGGSTIAVSSSTTSGGAEVTYSGNFWGIHGRVALHIAGRPSPHTSRRTSFTIGSDLNTTLAKGTVLAFLTVGIGADWY